MKEFSFNKVAYTYNCLKFDVVYLQGNENSLPLGTELCKYKTLMIVFLITFFSFLLFTGE